MSDMHTIVGIDLAWSQRNLTGLASGFVSETEVVITETRLVGSLDDMCQLIRTRGAGPMTIAIDAPTVVPHQNRMRDCERDLHRDAQIRRAHAGPYPGTRELLGRCNGGEPRGEELVRRLCSELACREVECPPAFHNGRHAIEVFPAAALVRLFDLQEPLPYKKKRARSWKQCQGGLQKVIAGARELRHPPLRFPDDIAVRDETGRAFKAIEDRMDAVICAYLAALTWLGRVQKVGSVSSGYIVLPEKVTKRS